ncbi:MAG: twin-arginine translocase subunit TatC [Bacteroidaceae bacterium]|nr:twin-arginine translocase subunit TatC [Bacteroidaceae bacterium]
MDAPEHDINATFWEHLDALRSVIIRIVVAVLIATVVAFCFKELLFQIILAPKYDDFLTYQGLWRLSELTGISAIAPEAFNVELINTGMASQFLIHVKMAFCMAILLVSPYILYSIFSFIAPALYRNERRYSVRFILGGYVMFILGVLLSYMLIFPLTFRFLGTYQVSQEVKNLINLDSYISTMMTLNLMMGILFELPVLCWLFAKVGFLKPQFMTAYRKHAIVVILIIAAVITPTSDAFTLSLVSLPIYLLYELSIIIVKHTYKPSSDDDDDEEEKSEPTIGSDHQIASQEQAQPALTDQSQAPAE